MLLHLDHRAPRTPRLPRRRTGALAQLAASLTVHAVLVVAAAAIKSTPAPGIAPSRTTSTTEQQVRHLVFLAPASPHMGGGGGGGGHQQRGLIRRAEGIGSDTITLRVRKATPPAVPLTAAIPSPIEDVAPIPAIVLEAKPLTSGILDRIGLPTSLVPSGTSTGPGSGGGVGSGVGTGIGPGRGPGLGPGSGGGTGGGVYRPGGAVSPPRLVKEVKPRYTADALRHTVQGTVVLEAVITSDGCPSQIRVVRSVDRGGLDEEAVAAVAQWRFEPGRLEGAPVAVLITILVDFSIR